jgi:23S rRNA pseudouridine1911/1915/1917 synthase
LSNLVSFIIGANPPTRLDKALARDVPAEFALSRTRLAALVGDGAVTVNGALATSPKQSAAEGDKIALTLPEAQESHILPEAIPLDIVFEDEALIVVNKPAGMVVHPAPGTPSGTLVNALLAHCGDRLSGVGGVARPGIVHRIDKDTSGLLVVAKNDAAHQGLAAQFAQHSAQRKYLALCYGVPQMSDPRLAGLRGVSFEPGGVVKITSGLDRHKTERQKQAVVFGAGRHAVTRAHVLKTFGEPKALSLVQCQLETGRTHQIRVHMTHIGHSLVGDPTYGGRRKLKRSSFSPAAIAQIEAFSRQALHAATLGFTHPLTEAWHSFEAPLPADFRTLLENLK